MASVKIDQALIQHFLAGDFGIGVAHENLPYQPVIGEPYAEIIVLQNDITPLDFGHTNETDGIFRVILRYPSDTGAMDAKRKADEIFTHFKIGSQIEYETQKLMIVRHDRAAGYSEQGWYKIVMTIGYRAFLAR